MPKMWGGRFKKKMAHDVEKFTSSIQYDKRLYEDDIAGSIAHVKGLQKAKVLTAKEAASIIRGLTSILHDVQQGKVNFSEELEDIHMNIESILTKRVGEVGKKVHTGRSRNDQVVTDLRRYVKKETANISKALIGLQKVLLSQAEKNSDVFLPGFTHLQHAQPVLLAHHFLAYIEMFERDKGRLADCLKRVDVMPLGSAALAGTAYPVDRQFVARQLGFVQVTQNSLDAVSDRDFIVEFLSALSLIMVHLSRLSEELILWMTPEFGFIQMSDDYTTGSSLMPQKKNPDCAELTRGKTGRVIGSLVSILVVLKGLPLSYNRDLQEDKEGLFDAIDTVSGALSVVAGMVEGLTVKEDAMQKQAAAQYTLATDLADYLVKKGIPFREAHEIVGKIVAYCVEQRLELSDVDLDMFRKYSSKIDKDVYKVLTVENSLALRNVIGGTAPRQVQTQLNRWKKQLR